MPKLVALKRLRYPRGPQGKEYNIGDSFDVLSDRDAKALTLIRVARAESDEPEKPKPVLRTTAMRAEPVRPPAAPMTTESASEVTRSPRYRRRDQQAED